MPREKSNPESQRKKPRGRPRRNPVDRLRSLIWYRAVKARTDWSNYRLDIEFGGDGEQKPKGDNRPRIFEQIKRLGVVPSAGNHPRRKFDLVARVDSHKDFAGTAAIFHSPFWHLMKFNRMDLKDVAKFVAENLARLSIFRSSSNLDVVIKTSFIRGGVNAYEHIPKIYHLKLKMALAQQPLSLDTIALLGGLYREAYLACSLEIALVLKTQLLEMLERFTSQAWLGEIGSELMYIADQRILFLRDESEPSWEEIYDDFPSEVMERVLLPMDEATRSLLQNEEQLFSEALGLWIQAYERMASKKGPEG